MPQLHVSTPNLPKITLPRPLVRTLQEQSSSLFKNIKVTSPVSAQPTALMLLLPVEPRMEMPPARTQLAKLLLAHRKLVPRPPTGKHQKLQRKRRRKMRRKTKRKLKRRTKRRAKKRRMERRKTTRRRVKMIRRRKVTKRKRIKKRKNQRRKRFNHHLPLMK
jgi:hypothetical protein